MTEQSVPPIQLIDDRIDENAVVRAGARSENAPIVLLLHGLGSHERDLISLVPHLPPGFAYASLRGIHRWVQGYAWLEADIDPHAPQALETSTAAVRAWIAQESAPVVGAIGFSQGGMLALHLLREDPHLFSWIVQLSGAPFPAPHPGDDALAQVQPPALWGHGGLDPLFDPEREDMVRDFMNAHTDLTEVRREYLGHAIDAVELQEIAAFVQARWDEHAAPQHDTPHS